MDKKLNDLVDKALSRRSFLAGAGTVAAGTLMAGCGNNTTVPAPAPTPAPTPAALTDSDYLNFALNLEYLEAEFYLRAATGNGLSAADIGTSPGAVTAPSTTQLVGLTPLQSAYLYEIAQNELDHVRFLRAALTPAVAVARPAIDLTFFGPLAMAAGITTDNSFTPFASYPAYLIGAFIFEDVGVTAYHGAALALQSKAFLTAGAEIHAVEAYHAASIRTQIVATDYLAGLAANKTITTYTDIANKVSALRGTLGGGNETTLGQGSIVAADSKTSIGYKRSTDQVLHIVYGQANGAGVPKGGFFPAGLNGNIKITLG